MRIYRCKYTHSFETVKLFYDFIGWSLPELFSYKQVAPMEPWMLGYVFSLQTGSSYGAKDSLCNFSFRQIR